MQELITKNNEKRRLEKENRTLKASIELSIGRSSTGRQEGRIHQRGPIRRPTGSYSDATSEEEGLKKGEIPKRKRAGRYLESHEEKWIARQIRFDRDSQMGKGRIEISPSTRYHVVRREPGPVRPERRIRHNEADAQKIEGELEIVGD